MFGSEKTFDIYKVSDIKFGSAIQKGVLCKLDILADSTKLFHQRAIYNILDFLGDIGGLLDALKLIAATFVGLITNKSLSNYLISKLFYILPSSV